MPDPFNRAKMTGDFHPPDVESELPLDDGSDNAADSSGVTTDRGHATDGGRSERHSRDDAGGRRR